MQPTTLQLFTLSGRKPLQALAGRGLGGTTLAWENPSQPRMSPCVF
jgi:hypothetical protein